MKNNKIFLSIFFLVTFSLSSFAHSSGNTTFCFWPWKKYHATAKVNYLYKYDWVTHKIPDGFITVWNGSAWVQKIKYVTVTTYDPFWTTKRVDKENSCGSVHADAEWFHNFGGSTGWRVGHAGWKTGSGYSYNVTQYSNHYKIKAGLFERVENVNREKFEILNKEGFTKTDINADVLIEDQKLIIRNLKGNVSIENNSNFYSTFKVIVYKESKNSSEKEHNTLLENYDNMEYTNVVTQGAISISKNKIELEGFFKSTFDIKNFYTKAENSYGVDLSDINLTIPLNKIELKEDEMLAFALVADGGLDFSSVIEKVETNSYKSVGLNSSISNNSLITVYPNPSSDVVNITLPNKDESYRVEMYNISGQKTLVKAFGNEKGLSFATNNLPNGTYFLKIQTSNNDVETKKIIISH